MAATVLTPVKLALTTTLADLTTAVAVGKVRSYDVRFANVGATDATADLVLTDGTTSINRAKSYPLPYQMPGAAPDMEQRLVVPAGWKLAAKASANNAVEASVTGVEADATDFA
jgi:hypothetical protein